MKEQNTSIQMMLEELFSLIFFFFFETKIVISVIRIWARGELYSENFKSNALNCSYLWMLAMSVSVLNIHWLYVFLSHLFVHVPRRCFNWSYL